MLILPLTIALAVQAAKLPLSEVPMNLLAPVPAKEKVMAKVNGVEIKASDVEALLWDWRKDDIVNDLISFRVIKDAATKRGLTATDAEIEDAKTKLLEALKLTLNPGQTMEQLMQQEGTTPSRIHLRVHTEVLLKKITLKDFNKNNFVSISTIILHPGEKADDIRKALDQADGIYKDLKTGKKWDDIFDKVETDPNAKAAHGRVGWRFLSAFPDSVRDEITGLKIGDYTKPVQTKNGIQIFRVDAKGIDATGDDLAELQDWYANGMRQTMVENLRKESKVEMMDTKRGG
jgi:parvulin-like peptidyl-prolyl isomerase